MTRRLFLGCACCGGMTAGARPLSAADPHLPTRLELGVAAMTRIAPDVWVAPLARGVWLHCTTAAIAGGVVYPANGLIVASPRGAIMIDTAWNPDQARSLLAWSDKQGLPVSTAVATHFHGDRTGGIPALRAAGVPVLASADTCEQARRHGLPVPDTIAAFDRDVCLVDPDLELFYPGAGHSRDNIVAFVPSAGIVSGGCLVKSTTTDNLGYIADAILPAWPDSIRRVRARYPFARHVVPGHGAVAGDNLSATLALLKA